jgi:hypothetical protein
VGIQTTMAMKPISLHFWFGDFPSARTLDLEVLAGNYCSHTDHVVIFCDAVLPSCSINKTGSKTICNACIGRTKHNHSLIGLSASPIPLSSLIDSNEINTQKTLLPTTISPLTLTDMENPISDIGMGPLSSAISFTRDRNFVEDNTVKLAEKLTLTSLIVHKAVTKAIGLYDPNSIFVHNGRLAEYHSVLITGRKHNIDVFTHEVCTPHTGWYLFKNGRVHDREHYSDLIRTSVTEVPQHTLASVAAEYLVNKRRGTSKYENFTSNQNIDQRSYVIDNDQHVVSIFTSSDDEFAAIGPEWKIPFFDSQHSAIRFIIEKCHLISPSTLFLVRMHPNMAKMHPADLLPYYQLEGKNIHLIPCDSSVDSYSVVDDANVILTFGSTIGLEATYWGKTVVQLGHSLFEHLDVCYLPENKEEVVNWLLNPPPPKPKGNGYPYVYSICHGGYPYRFTYWGQQTVTFRHQELMGPTFGITDYLIGLIPLQGWLRFIHCLRKQISFIKERLTWF